MAKHSVCKITLLFLALFTFSSRIYAQNATKILDTAAAKYKQAGGVKINYTYTLGSEHGTGVLKSDGNKFVNDTGNIIVWFNGKSLWTLVKENEEVNLTNPTESEIAKLNPNSYLNLYKKGYKASKGKSTSVYHEVILQATSAKATIQKIIVKIDKKTYQPTYIHLTGKGLNSEINITQYQTFQKFSVGTFTFNSKQYPDYELIDLR